MTARLPPSRLLCRKALQNLTVRLIDAEVFRNRSLECQEFGGWATSIDYPKIIPDGEIWIDQNASEVDQRYYLINAYAEREAIAAGDSEDDAYDYALAVERSERERETQGGEGSRPRHEEIPPDVYVEHLQDVQQDDEVLEVWVVNGTLVRDLYKTDWTEGGNAFAYPFQPIQEIWIEDIVVPDERPKIIKHEVTERGTLKHERMGYEDAHDAASKVEFAERQHDKSLDQEVEQLTPEMQRAKNVDLIRTTQKVKTCANCMFIDNGYCKHEEVDQVIDDPEGECCGKWDVLGTKRVWEESVRKTAQTSDTKTLSAFNETTGGALMSLPARRRIRKSLLLDPEGRKRFKGLRAKYKRAFMQIRSGDYSIEVIQSDDGSGWWAEIKDNGRRVHMTDSYASRSEAQAAAMAWANSH